MMNQEEKQAWLDGLQIGDRVYVHTRHSKSITAIENITKTRRIITKSGHRFNADGSLYGRGSGWNFADIDPVTDEILLEFKMKKIISKIDDVNWNTVSFGNLTKIAAILDLKV